MIHACGVATEELCVAVRANIGRGEVPVVEPHLERQTDCSYAIVAMVADIKSARYYGRPRGLNNKIIAASATGGRTSRCRARCRGRRFQRRCNAVGGLRPRRLGHEP